MGLNKKLKKYCIFTFNFFGALLFTYQTDAIYFVSNIAEIHRASLLVIDNVTSSRVGDDISSRQALYQPQSLCSLFFTGGDQLNNTY